MRRYGFTMFVVAALVFVGITAVAENRLNNPQAAGGSVALPPAPHGEATEALFRGDMVAEIGLGCSNSVGTSGGPNDWAVGVTATLTPPFGIISTTYNVFTNVATGLTAFTFKAWAPGGSPGAELGVRPLGGAAGSQGNHTVAVSPAITITTPSLYFGFYQPQATVGMRLGEDTSSGSAGTSFIRAPTCGASSFMTIDSIGYPGNWVMRAIVDDTVPVELMSIGIE
jgi:hypothetical protein